jgi:hypothetical protein
MGKQVGPDWRRRLKFSVRGPVTERCREGFRKEWKKVLLKNGYLAKKTKKAGK